jgi:AbiU2
MATFTYKPTPAEDRFWRVFEGMRADVGVAIKSNRTYLMIYNVKSADQDFQVKIRRYPDLWTTLLYSLQTTFFISFGRLFDKGGDSLSVARLMDIVVKNPQLFSKAALLLRKRFDNRVEGEDPEWLTQYIAAAWEPNSADLKPLLSELTPHCERFKKIHAPIRNEIYAHRSKKNEEDVYIQFSKTTIGDVETILRFVHTLLAMLQELILNGRKPDLTNFTGYDGSLIGLGFRPRIARK